MHRFAAVAVLDPWGRLLLQERGDDALHDPGRWGYPGGDLEDGEDFVTAAVRELSEETGLAAAPDRLESLGVRRFRSETCGEYDEFELFAVRLPVTDDDVVCGEGRQMVFVDPDALEGRELHQATTLTLDRVLEWGARPVRTDFVQVTLVDPRGRGPDAGARRARSGVAGDVVLPRRRPRGWRGGCHRCRTRAGGGDGGGARP